MRSTMTILTYDRMIELYTVGQDVVRFPSAGVCMSAAAREISGVAGPIEGLDVGELRRAIRDEYALVATEPGHGFHFHTGRRLAAILGYDAEWLEGVPEGTIA